MARRVSHRDVTSKFNPIEFSPASAGMTRKWDSSGTLPFNFQYYWYQKCQTRLISAKCYISIDPFVSYGFYL